MFFKIKNNLSITRALHAVKYTCIPHIFYLLIGVVDHYYYVSLVSHLIWYGMVHSLYGIVWYGIVWYGIVWCAMVWYGCVYISMVYVEEHFISSR